MSQAVRTLEEVRRAGFTALARELGPIDTMRFLRMFDRGSGDYSTERHAWLDRVPLDELFAEQRSDQPRRP